MHSLLSLAEASRAYDYVRPHMVEESLIDIKGGRYIMFSSCLYGEPICGERHPLQEKVVDTFVPNDTFMVGGAGIGVSAHRYANTDDGSEMSEPYPARSVIVCTGANACGKSVYLKQVCL